MNIVDFLNLKMSVFSVQLNVNHQVFKKLQCRFYGKHLTATSNIKTNGYIFKLLCFEEESTVIKVLKLNPTVAIRPTTMRRPTPPATYLVYQ